MSIPCNSCSPCWQGWCLVPVWELLLFNNFHAGDVMEEDNRRMCEEMTGLPVLACVARGDRALPGLEAEKLAALFD